MTEHPRTGVGAPDSGNGGTDHPTVQLPPVPSVGAPPAAAGGETPTRSVAGFRTQRLDPTAYGAYYSGPDEGPASPAERPPYRLEPVPHTPYPELATTTLLRPVKPPPSEGWRRLLYLLSGRLINAGKALGPRTSTTWSLRSTAAARLLPDRGVVVERGCRQDHDHRDPGGHLADLRGDRVVAVDANPDRGTLSQKVPLETPATVRHLLRDADGIERYSDVRGYTSKGPSGLEVLASDSDPASSDAFSADDYTRTLDILERFYGLVLTDCGTGLLHSAMSAVLPRSDVLVVVSSGSIDGARSAAATLDWLQAHGHDDQVRNSIAVVNAVRPRAGKVDVGKVVEHFLQALPCGARGAVRPTPRRRRRNRAGSVAAGDPRSAHRTGSGGGRWIPRRPAALQTELHLGTVIVPVPQPPQELWIVVGPDDASLGPVHLCPCSAPAKVDQRRQNQHEEQVEHSTPPWTEYTRAVGSGCVRSA